MDYVIVCTLCYFVLVGLLYAPKCPKAESQDFKIDYFPEVEEPQEVSQAIATKPETVEPKPITETAPATDANPLDTLSIRKLKKLASTAKIRRYSSLTKAQLINSLRGLEPATSAT